MIGYPPKMNIPEQMMDRFQAAGQGIDYFSTANNHSLDMGVRGIRASGGILEPSGGHRRGRVLPERGRA